MSRELRITTLFFLAGAKNRFAARAASFLRTAVELNTTQWTSAFGCSRKSRRIVPPHPISMSSQCEPRHRIRHRGRSAEPKRKSTIASARHIAGRFAGRRFRGLRCRSCTLRSLGVPNHPWRVTARVQIVQLLFVLERIHRSVKAVVLVSHQLLFLDQALEGFEDQLFAFAHILENILLQDKV